MLPQTFIFFGRSGSGKGTQALLLKKYLEATDPEKKVLYIETGERIREFIQESNTTSRMVKEVIDRGGLLPVFLPVWIWTDFLIRRFTGVEHLILDGLSRRISEAPVLDGALKFYGRSRPFVVLLTVSREWSRGRLLNRGRKDDTTKDIDARLEWYDSNVLPTIEFFRNNPYYTIIEINGEQPIEVVTKELLEKVGPLMHEA